MNVIEMVLEITFILNSVFPVPSLPDSGFVTCQMGGISRQSLFIVR